MGPDHSPACAWRWRLAKGLAAGLGPIVGVPSLEAWLDADPSASAAVARAGAREAYLAGAAARSGPSIVDRDDLVTLEGPVVAPAELATAFGLAGARSPRGATAIARRAAERLATEPSGDDLATLEPLYLREPRGVAAATGEAR